MDNIDRDALGQLYNLYYDLKRRIEELEKKVEKIENYVLEGRWDF